MRDAVRTKSSAVIYLTLPMELFDHVENQVDAGRAINRGDFIRSLLIRDMDQVNAKIVKTKPAVKA